MIIGLTGYARSGKDSIAEVLVNNFGFTRVAFADPIKNLLYEINPIVGAVANEPRYLRDTVKSEGWEKAKANPEIRRLLQMLGVGARTTFYKDFWVDMALTDVNNYKTSKFVITDVRFENEAEAIKRMGGGIWRVERPGVLPVNSHVSELEMADYPVDVVFQNNSTLEDLTASVKARMVGLLA
jgi:hypothetical protein